MSSPPIKEISAFHPGEMYGTPSAGGAPTQLPGTNVLDGWSDAQYHKPESGKYVTGWTGRSICKVRYDYGRHIWITDNGIPIKVLIWCLN